MFNCSLETAVFSIKQFSKISALSMSFDKKYGNEKAPTTVEEHIVIQEHNQIMEGFIDRSK